ncbi:MAG: D-amino acid aminotransferase [Gammaproteobacteria bacterium]
MADALPTCLLDGEFVATREARVSPLDRGFLFGDGIYEVVPCYGGRPLRLDAHLARLTASLDALGIANPYPEARWRELLAALVEKNGGGNLGVYLQVTRGAGDGRDFLPEAGLQPTVFGFAWPLAPPRPDQLERGIAGATLEDIRWLHCDIKSIALIAAVMLRREAAQRGADEAILIRDEHLAEGSSSAVFVVKDGAISTPPASRERLPSITREVVGDAITALDLPFVEREIAADELAGMDEIWIASATREALAITRLDGQPVGDDRPGPVWKRVYGEFQALKKRECGA